MNVIVFFFPLDLLSGGTRICPTYETHFLHNICIQNAYVTHSVIKPWQLNVISMIWFDKLSKCSPPSRNTFCNAFLGPFPMHTSFTIWVCCVCPSAPTPTHPLPINLDIYLLSFYGNRLPTVIFAVFNPSHCSFHRSTFTNSLLNELFYYFTIYTLASIMLLYYLADNFIFLLFFWHPLSYIIFQSKWLPLSIFFLWR